jgi:putative ABC transport system permease protein
MFHDLRYAFRVLGKDLGFAIVVALVMGLGIGANSAIFTVVDAVLLRPLPYQHSNRLVTLWGSNPKRAVGRGAFSIMRLDQLRSQSQSFSSVAGWCTETFNLTGVDQPEQLQAARVSASFLQTLGVRPLLGRDFLPDEDRVGGKPVVLMSYGLWQRRFGGNPSIVGTALTLDSGPSTVIGILPPKLDQPLPDLDVLATNLAAFSRFTSEQIHAGGGYLFSIARLKPDVTLQQAQAEMDVLAHQYLQANVGKVDADPDGRIMAGSLRESLVENSRPALLVLCAAVGLVLLIACANVASLLLARTAGRRGEFAVRVALGAGRVHLLRQLLAESLLLIVASCGVGLLLAQAAVKAVGHIDTLNVPRAGEIHIDGQTLGFTLAISILTGIGFSLMPPLEISKQNWNEILRERDQAGAGSLGRNRVRSFLVIGQVALSMMLLIAASLLMRSSVALQRVDPGFNPKNILTMSVTLPDAKYPTDPRKGAFFRQTLNNISSLPGVLSASAVLRLPMTGRILAPILRVGEARIPFGKRTLIYWQSITPDYFRTLQARLLAGRFFAEHDDLAATPVAIVNESLARRIWPNQDPLGRRLVLSRKEIVVQIVGVVADIKSGGLDSDSGAELYSPYAQRPWPAMSLAIRTVDPNAMTNTVQKSILWIGIFR